MAMFIVSDARDGTEPSIELRPARRERRNGHTASRKVVRKRWRSWLPTAFEQPC
jgi:hypothetical protein